MDWTNIRCLCSGCNGLLKPCACGILCACLMDVRLPSELTSSPPFCFIYLPQTLLFFATLTGSPKILFYQHTIRDYSDLRKKKMRASWENWGNYTFINVRATQNSTTAYYRALIVYLSTKNLTLFHSGIRALSKSAQETMEIFCTLLVPRQIVHLFLHTLSMMFMHPFFQGSTVLLFRKWTFHCNIYSIITSPRTDDMLSNKHPYFKGEHSII